MRRLFLALMMAGVASPGVPQEATLSLNQIERKYRGMSPVHINKCDYNQDSQFTSFEQLCVAGIYQQMYVDTDD